MNVHKNLAPKIVILTISVTRKIENNFFAYLEGIGEENSNRIFTSN